MQIMLPAHKLMTLLLVTLCLISCGMLRVEQTVFITANPKANLDFPTDIDIVFINADDKALFSLVSGFTAKEWFEQKAQIRAEVSKQIKIASYTVVPGYSMKHVEERGLNQQGFIFVNYRPTNASKSIRVGDNKVVRILLRESDAEVVFE